MTVVQYPNGGRGEIAEYTLRIDEFFDTIEFTPGGTETMPGFSVDCEALRMDNGYYDLRHPDTGELPIRVTVEWELPD
jgi:hypothetical protein